MKKLVVIIAVICLASCNGVKKESDFDNTEESIPQIGTDTSYLCPSCRSDSVAVIEYGLVSRAERENMDSLHNELRKRRHVLGGCVVHPNSPKYYCYKCTYRW